MSEPQFQQMAFSPEVLARIAPDISLQRHLAVDLRPSLRGLLEFRPLNISAGGLNESGQNSLVGLAIAKNGETRVVVGINLGLIQENAVDELLSGSVSKEVASQYTSVYPVVEISRGRLGAPTDEEMIISQKLHESIYHAKLVKRSSLTVNVGNMIDGDFESLPQEDQRWSFVLYAHIKVFSRSGPLFDLCHAALLAALENTKLPRAFIDENSTDIKIPIRGRKFGHIRQQKNLILDTSHALPLPLEKRNTSLTFGVVVKDSDGSAVLLADLEGEAEELSATLKIAVVASDDNMLSQVDIVGGGAQITKELLIQAISIARERHVLGNNH